METTDRDGLQRLARLVVHRRVKLGWHKAQAAAAADLTITTYMRVEKGMSVRDVTYGKIESALGWAPGACEAILAGATEAQEAGEIVEGVRVASAAGVEAEVRQVLQNGVIAAMPGVPAGQIGEFSEGVIAELRRRGILPPSSEDSSG